jgi:transcriptional regulator of arginine metabolism
MKKSRQEDLVKLILGGNIKTQEELTAKLIEKGYDVTQATVSRDIKELKIIKIIDEAGEVKYVINKSPNSYEDKNTGISFFKKMIIDVKSSANIIVIKTTAGMAQGVAATIDSLKYKEILGTIAGDDTIMVVCQDEFHISKITKYIKENLV